MSKIEFCAAADNKSVQCVIAGCVICPGKSYPRCSIKQGVVSRDAQSSAKSGKVCVIDEAEVAFDADQKQAGLPIIAKLPAAEKLGFFVAIDRAAKARTSEPCFSIERARPAMPADIKSVPAICVSLVGQSGPKR